MGRSVEVELNTSEKPESGPVLHKKYDDQIVWYAENRGYRIKFDQGDGTPFGDAEFEVPHKGSQASGKVRADARPGDYRYSVHPLKAAKRDGAPADPKVIIKP